MKRVQVKIAAQTLQAFLLCLLLTLSLCSCAFETQNIDRGTSLKYNNFRDIPGITAEDINAIDELLATNPVLTYGLPLSTEAFYGEDGSLSGFVTLFYARMSELFGFEFVPQICEWNELLEGIESKEIDFTAEFTPTPERMEKYFMTDPFIQRALKVFTNKNSPTLDDISKTRKIRCGFVEGTTIYDMVSSSWYMPFEPVFTDSDTEAAKLLIENKIDAYIDESVMELLFDSYNFIDSTEFYPLKYSPVSLTTGNSELLPIINIMQKYLKNGGLAELANIYNQGDKDYLKYKLFNSLTDEEKEYIQRHNDEGVAILVACESDNYPSCFYNSKENEFQGSAIDVLNQISELTGLEFKPGNESGAIWSNLFDGLENGSYALTTELLYTSNREDRFLWAKNPYSTSNYALLSRADYPDVDINQILFNKVGLEDDTAFSDVFYEWFPNSVQIETYVNYIEAFTALEKGEIDLLMGTQNLLLYITNYREKPNFKINLVFNYKTESYFGFNKDEELLCSIIDKAQYFVNVERISDSWERKMFDYDSKMFRDMVPYLAVFSVLLLTAFLVVVFLLMKNKKMNKNLEGLIEKRTSDLALQTAMLTTIFESIPDIVFCKDLNSNFTRFNHSFKKHFNCSDDIIGKNDETGLGLSAGIAEAYQKADKDIIIGRKSVTVEETIPSADGRWPLFETIKTPLIQDDVPVGIVCISRNITRRKLAEKAIENASRAKGEFLSHMSHEIRTPLNAIIGMNNIALNSNDLSKAHQCNEKIANASRHLLGIINDILDMSKIEADKFDLSYREFNFENALMGIINVTNFQVEEKNQEFVVNLGKDVPANILGDELRLSQIITNLLSNAVKFTPEYGSIVLNVEKIAEAGKDVTLQIAVVDSGIGISEEQQARLFTSFEQADSSISGKFGGTGLGLAISKRIVELMGGNIWIESKLGQGSKFVFTISVKKCEEKAPAKISPQIDKTNIRILAVDDSKETLDCFSRVMEANNLPCNVAGSGVEALEMIKQCGDKPYNIFFVDWQMPEMDGIELTRKIKELTSDNSVVFMISIAAWSNIENEAFSAGVRSFISKPLFPSSIVNAINECLGVESAKTELYTQDAGSMPDFGSHSILIAEDIEVNQEIMAAVLEDTGVAIEFANNGQEAVAMFSKNLDKYDLILMDIQMPEMDGYEATRHIRAIESAQAKDIPIIAMTANVFKEDIENCLSAGMNNHVGKPIDSNDLFNKLGKYLK